MNANVFLQFNGNCKEAFDFYSKATGCPLGMTMTYGDSPASDQTPPEMKDKVIYTQLTVGDSVVMGCDSPPQFFATPQGFNLCVGVDTDEDAERIFAGLSEGGHVVMPMEETFFATRFGMLKDKFGTPWMVIHTKMPG